MSYAPKIQALIGTNTNGLASNSQCAADWARSRVFIGSKAGTATLSRVNILSGAEEIYAPISDYPDANPVPPVGLDSSGNVYFSANGLSGVHGGIIQVDGNALIQNVVGPYISPYQTGGGLTCVSTPAGDYMLDAGLGGGVFASLGSTLLSKDTVYLDQTPWGHLGTKSYLCSAKLGSNQAYQLITRTGAPLASITLMAITCYPLFSAAVFAALVPTDFDPSWTSIRGDGLCLDQTDGNIIVSVDNAGSGPGNRNAIAKIDVATGAVLWCSIIPPLGSALGYGSSQFQYSSITNQRIAMLTQAPPTVSIYDTADGSLVDSFSTGLTGLTVWGQQCYNDSLGAILCNVHRTNVAGAPTPLNSTPLDYNGWSMLYVADAPAPPPGPGRRWFALMGPVRPRA